MGTKAAIWQPAPEGYLLSQSGLTGELLMRGLTPGLRKLALPFGGAPCQWPGPVIAVRTLQSAGKKPFKVGFHLPRPRHRLRADRVDVELDASARCPARL